jgi:hypothetical protein
MNTLTTEMSYAELRALSDIELNDVSGGWGWRTTLLLIAIAIALA